MRQRTRKVAVATVVVAGLAACAVVVGKAVEGRHRPRLQALADAGLTQYRSHVAGWEDSVERFAFTATPAQVARIADTLAMHKTRLFACEESTSRNRLASVTEGRPRWFTIQWSPALEHYEAVPGPPVWKEMVYDPGSGQCRLKIWDD